MPVTNTAATEVEKFDPALGERMHSFGVVLQGALSQERWIEFLKKVTQTIGMSAVGEAKVWTYPVDGKGGCGQTIVLPITESFLALDTWPDHRGAYLLVCSCLPFQGWTIDLVAIEFGLKPGKADNRGRFYAELNLK